MMAGGEDGHAAGSGSACGGSSRLLTQPGIGEAAARQLMAWCRAAEGSPECLPAGCQVRHVCEPTHRAPCAYVAPVCLRLHAHGVRSGVCMMQNDQARHQQQTGGRAVNLGRDTRPCNTQSCRWWWHA